MSEFLITRWVCGSSDEINIDKVRFDSVRRAKAGVLLLTEYDEKMAVILDNYLEFEVEIFTHSLRWAIHEDWRWESRRDQVFTINRRLINFLNVVSMYFDHTKRIFRRLPDISQEQKSKLFTKLDAASSSEPMLAMIKLRNYCQHQGFGIEGVGVQISNYNMQRRVPPSNCEIRKIISPELAIEISDLANTRGDSGKGILSKTHATNNNKWDPQSDIRKAVDELTHFHNEIRAELKDWYSIWRSCLSEVIEEAKVNFGKTAGLCIVERKGRGKYEDHIEVFDDLLQRVDELQIRNGNSTDLENTIVTTSIPIIKT